MLQMWPNDKYKHGQNNSDINYRPQLDFDKGEIKMFMSEEQIALDT